MRRFTWLIALVMCLSFVLAGCGQKDAGSVVKDLDGVINKLQSYQGSGKMILHTGQEPQEYQVEVWYQNPHYYRISLTNAKKDITQIVLRNDDGVFVLTPHLNKSFRFQSDWPENQGQVYLYQSLVQSILMDNDRQFTVDPNAYVFDVLANYQNGSLARQKIWLDKKSYAPQKVEVSDQESNVMVIVDFNQFEFGKKFDKDSFDMQRNMTSWNIQSLPTMGPADPANTSGDKAVAGDNKAGAAGTHDPGTMDGKGSAATGSTGAQAAPGTAGTAAGAAAGATGTTGSKDAASSNATGANGSKAGAGTSSTGAAGNKAAGASGANAGASAAPGSAGTASTTAGGTSADASKQKSGQQSFGVIEPRYTPTGVKRQDVNEIKLGDEKGIMLRYAGKFNYTLVESRPETQTVSNLPTDIVDLGYTLAVITGDEKKTLMWTYEGVEFRLSTGDLPLTEMIKVAQTVQGETGK